VRDPGDPVRQRGIRAESDQTGDAVAAMSAALLARDDKPLELADQIGGSDGAVARHRLDQTQFIA